MNTHERTRSRMTITRQIGLVAAVVLAALPLSAQTLQWKLNADSSQWIRLNAMVQPWFLVGQANPGTTINGDAQDAYADVGLRRLRFQMTAQITDRALFYVQYGENNFTSFYNSGGNRKLAAFFHDAVAEYRLSDGNESKVGMGLTIANGLSRFSQPSVSSIMTTDVPVFAQATVDQTDQFSRKLSVLTRGQIGPIDYRFVLSDPFVIQSNGAPQPAINPSATFAQKGHAFQYQGYVIWQFLDHEPHLTPYMAGTYLGKKKVFNIAAGAIYQPHAMWRTGSTPTDTVYDDMKLWAIESFYDAPCGSDGHALSAYAGYFHTDYGMNYLRYNGIMNPGQGGAYGNAIPMFGTGNVIYSQVGYFIPQVISGTTGMMPYVTATFSDYDALHHVVSDVYALGCSLLLHDHAAKVSVDVSSRPTFSTSATGETVKGDRKLQLVVQYQLFL